MAACLLVLDDTIRLTEWLAYHYTVLPLSNLIVAVDPKSSLRSIERMNELASRWEPLGLRITFWYQDEWLRHKPYLQNYTLAEHRHRTQFGTTRYKLEEIVERVLRGAFRLLSDFCFGPLYLCRYAQKEYVWFTSIQQ